KTKLKKWTFFTLLLINVPNVLVFMTNHNVQPFVRLIVVLTTPTLEKLKTNFWPKRNLCTFNFLKHLKKVLFFINFFGKAIAKFEAVKKNILLIFLFFMNFHLFANPEIDSLISLRNKILKTSELSQIERLNNDFIPQ